MGTINGVTCGGTLRIPRLQKMEEFTSLALPLVTHGSTSDAQNSKIEALASTAAVDT